MAVAAPLWSSRMDRHGQARVILISLGCLVLAASALLALVLTAAPFWTWLVAAFRDRCGDARPHLGGARAVDRARPAVAADRGPRTRDHRRPDGVHLGAAGHHRGRGGREPGGRDARSLTLGVVGGVWLASQRRTQPAASAATGRARLVLPPAGVVPVALACIALGGVFGAFDVTVVGWAEVGGRPWLAGPAFSALALAIAVGSVITGARRGSCRRSHGSSGSPAAGRDRRAGAAAHPVGDAPCCSSRSCCSPAAVARDDLGILVASARAPEAA